MRSTLLMIVLVLVLAGCATTGRAAGGLDFIGNVWPSGVSEDSNFQDHWSQITPENGGKWGSVEAARDSMRWGDLDNAYAAAKRMGMSFRLHTLVWGQQQPAWLDALSPADQRAEIEQWFGALADRYPDVDYIDVVNEPLHAPPSYSEALGGAGATGWDWVITSFELARRFFPHAKLELNEYNVLAYRQEAISYVALITLLADRGLIDAVGVQGHSLEQAGDYVIGSNLERLEATGLPIYVTELDVNYSDDIRQANRVAELMGLFAEHPLVRGVTFWGYLQGRTWKANAYLLNSDGTPRPALDWLDCYRGGGECDLPKYVAQARVGTAAGVRIEAEEFDESQGVDAAGSVIANVDTGDWVLYRNVLFNTAYTALKYRYARGSAGAGGVEFRLDSLDRDPVLVLPVRSTGGWSEFSAGEVPFPGIAGPHDLYLTFTGGQGVANIDYFEIGRPGRAGGDSLTLEAESLDEQGGLEVYGEFIGYADDGDWLKFANVDLGTYDTLDVTYGRGVDDPGTVEVRLDSLDGPLAATLTPEGTGGWNAFTTVTVPFRGTSGAHDLYVLFIGSEGLGNFDRFVLKKAP